MEVLGPLMPIVALLPSEVFLRSTNDLLMLLKVPEVSAAVMWALIGVGPWAAPCIPLWSTLFVVCAITGMTEGDGAGMSVEDLQ